MTQDPCSKMRAENVLEWVTVMYSKSKSDLTPLVCYWNSVVLTSASVNSSAALMLWCGRDRAKNCDKRAVAERTLERTLRSSSRDRVLLQLQRKGRGFKSTDCGLHSISSLPFYLSFPPCLWQWLVCKPWCSGGPDIAIIQQELRFQITSADAITLAIN